MTPPEHTAALHVCQADLRAAVNDILREAQPQLLQPQLLSPQLLPPPAAAAADGAPATAPQQVSDLVLVCYFIFGNVLGPSTNPCVVFQQE